MDMSGEQRIPAPREMVWQALNDPEILKLCIPGCQDLSKSSETEMSAKVVLKVGPVSARFEGAVRLCDLDPPSSYRISGEGQGGMAGFAKGEARVRLEADGDETILHYEVEAQVGGKLAQLGARLIDATAKQMSAAFFKRFATEIVARTAQTQPAEAAPTFNAPVGPPSHGAQYAPSGVLPETTASAPPAVWSPGLIALCVVAAALAASAYFLSGVMDAGGSRGISTDFAAAVVLLLTAATGYLFGQLRAAPRPLMVVDRDTLVSLLDQRGKHP